MHLFLAIIMLVNIIVPNYDWTEEDARLLAAIMTLENGSTGKNDDENRQVLILTGAVVLNRVKSGDWGGDTIEKVLYAKGQYASYTKNNINKVDIPDYILELSKELLTYGCNVPDYVVFQSTQPKLGTVWKVIDGEYFATGGGHKHEGDDIQIDTNKSLYETQCRIRLIKKIKKFLKMRINTLIID